jgi:hypothetical protein
MSNGKIIQIIGAVIDVEFSEGNIPSIYNALIVSETGLTLEVQQQLGDNVVRARISSIMLTVLPTPAPPNKPTLPPLANGQTRSMTLIPVSNNSAAGANSS